MFTGVVTTTTSLDREAIDSYYLSVQAKDGATENSMSSITEVSQLISYSVFYYFHFCIFTGYIDRYYCITG